jgi:integrase
MGNTKSISGLELRKGKNTETIRICFQYRGAQCRESLKLTHTKQNIAYALRRRGEVLNAIERGTFVYHEFFPSSTRAKKIAATIARPPVTFGDLLLEYLGVAKRTLELSSSNSYEEVSNTYLFPKWKDKKVTELTSKEIRTWIMEFTIKRKTISSILTPMRNALEQAVIDEIIDSNPFDSIKLGKIVPRAQRSSDFTADPFNIDEIDAILKACTEPQEQNLILHAFSTGMRISEYIALPWENIDFAKFTTTVNKAFVDGVLKKGAKTEAGNRVIDMRQGAFDALMRQQAFTKQIGSFVFHNPLHGEPWTGTKPIRERWKRILLLAKVRYRNPYQTRHTFASSLLMLGANPLYVATQMGHTDTTMVMRTYGKWIGAGLDEDRRRRLEGIFTQIHPKRKNEFPVFG